MATKRSFLPDTVGVGYFNAPFSYVRAILGEPIYKTGYEGHDYKSDVVWQIIIKSNPIEIIRVYNYKNGKNYLGDEGKEVEQITYWKIGSNNREKARAYISKRLNVEVE